MSQGWFRTLVVFLLAAVVTLQSLVLRKLLEPIESPVTFARIRAAPAEKRRDLISQIPLVTIHGTADVEVRNTVDVEVENIYAIPVKIER